MQKSDREQKQNDIKAAIIEEVVMRCSCKFNFINIIDDDFSCRGSKGDFKNTVVYRARIALPPSTTDADDIVAEMDKWVQTKPSVRVNEAVLYIDPDCPVMLDSFDSDDCVTEATPSGQPIQSSSSSSSLPVGIIIGAAVAAIIIIILLVTAVVISVVYCRRKSSYRYNEVIT